MPITVTPTLSSTSGYLTDVRDQIMHLMKFIVMNPGGTSDMWENQLISFRSISSADESDRRNMSAILESRIRNILEQKFSEYSFDVMITDSDYSDNLPGDSRYSLNFSISIKAPGSDTFESAFVVGDINTDKSTNSININFSNSSDTAVLE